MIDKLSLTAYSLPDIKYLEEWGDIREDEGRRNIYRYLCRLDKSVVLYEPHKFSESVNAALPFTKIDINPKYFNCYLEFESYLFDIFRGSFIEVGELNVSRIDIAADIEDFPIDCILSMLRIARIRTESLSLYRGTIYAGTNPKIRIYDKGKEIRSRQRKGGEITEYEKRLVESGKSWTRFEIQIRTQKKTLGSIVSDPSVFASYFDRLEIFNFTGNEGNGVLQCLSKYINRKFRAELEKYRDLDIVETIKKQYVGNVTGWFDPTKEPF
jgi:Phage replication protein CRI